MSDMKKTLFYLMMLSIGFVSCNSNEPDSNNYVDLGLSSGVYWQVGDELGMYSYADAMTKYGSNLPTVEQIQELIDECKWTYIQGDGYIVTGPNGKTIKFSFNGMDGAGGGASGVGQLGMYWTSKREDNLCAYSLSLDFSGVGIQSFFSNIKESVKLVKQQWEIEEENDKNNPGNSDAECVDLGLPSRTQWYSQNEKKYTEYFTPNEGNQYKSKMPTKADWQELMDYCTWTWTGKGYKVIGGNGNYIMLPAAGYKPSTLIEDDGEYGYYLVNDGENNILNFSKNSVSFSKSYGNYRYSLRLISRYSSGGGSDSQSNQEYCWCIIMDSNIIGYQWATEQAISAECQSLSQSYGSPITYKKTSDNDINSCEAHNMYIGNDMDNSWDDFRAYNSNINASYDSYTKTLTIFGQGEMYNNDISSPWRQYQNVEHVVIENGITSIAHHAFKDLQALKTIVIPNSVTRIGEYAFERCYQLQNVTLPINMKYIRQSAFKDCENLQFITIYAYVPPTVENQSAFMNYHYSNVPLQIPQSSHSAYSNHALWKKFNNIKAF